MFTASLLSNGSTRHDLLSDKNSRELGQQKVGKDLKELFIAYSKHYPVNFLEKLRNITKILREDDLGRDSN
jgi:hypothetical protein